MSKPFHEFLTCQQAAVRALRSVDTIRRWIRAGFLLIIDEPTKGTLNPCSYVIDARVLDVCIQKRQGLIPMEPGDRLMPAKPHVASSRLATAAWAGQADPRTAGGTAGEGPGVQGTGSRREQAPSRHAPGEGTPGSGEGRSQQTALRLFATVVLTSGCLFQGFPSVNDF